MTRLVVKSTSAVYGTSPIQLLHEQDALAVLERATRQRLPRVFNVGRDGVLLLSQVIRRSGRIPAHIAEPAMTIVGRLLCSNHLVDYYSEQIRLLNYGRVLDTTVCAPNSASYPGGPLSRSSTTLCMAGRCDR